MQSLLEYGKRANLFLTRDSYISFWNIPFQGGYAKNPILLCFVMVVPTLQAHGVSGSTQKRVSATTLQRLLVSQTCVDTIQKCHELWTTRV